MFLAAAVDARDEEESRRDAARFTANYTARFRRRRRSDARHTIIIAFLAGHAGWPTADAQARAAPGDATLTLRQYFDWPYSLRQELGAYEALSLFSPPPNIHTALSLASQTSPRADDILFSACLFYMICLLLMLLMAARLTL